MRQAPRTRPLSDGRPILTLAEAVRETEDLCDQFVVLLPDELLVRTALRGTAAYQLARFDAHMWAYAERRQPFPGQLTGGDRGVTNLHDRLTFR